MTSLQKTISSKKTKNKQNKKENLKCKNILNQFKQCIKNNGFDKSKEIEKMLDLCKN